MFGSENVVCLYGAVFIFYSRYISHFVYYARSSELKISLITQSTRYLVNHNENYIQVIYKLKIKYLSQLLDCYKLQDFKYLYIL